MLIILVTIIRILRERWTIPRSAREFYWLREKLTAWFLTRGVTIRSLLNLYFFFCLFRLFLDFVFLCVLQVLLHSHVCVNKKDFFSRLGKRWDCSVSAKASVFVLLIFHFAYLKLRMRNRANCLTINHNCGYCIEQRDSTSSKIDRFMIVWHHWQIFVHSVGFCSCITYQFICCCCNYQYCMIDD